MKTVKELSVELKKANKVLNALIFNPKESYENRPQGTIKKIIKQKKIVHAIEIKLWELSLD